MLVTMQLGRNSATGIDIYVSVVQAEIFYDCILDKSLKIVTILEISYFTVMQWDEMQYTDHVVNTIMVSTKCVESS